MSFYRLTDLGLEENAPPVIKDTHRKPTGNLPWGRKRLKFFLCTQELYLATIKMALGGPARGHKGGKG